jgi:hypothetical protein
MNEDLHSLYPLQLKRVNPYIEKEWMLIMENKQGLLYLTPKASYYNSKKEIVTEANRMHQSMLDEDRALYTYLLFFKNSTYFSKGLIIEKLLNNSLYKEENKELMEKDAQILAIEDALIHYALFNENITHALKLLLSLKEKRINNSRTSKVILNFLFNRGNLDRITIKYKQKVKELLIHAVGLGVAHSIMKREEKGMKKFNQLVKAYNNPFALETIDFVFSVEKDYQSPLYVEYMKVRNDFKNNTVKLDNKTNLPIEVLEGFNSHYKRHIHISSLLNAAVVSDKQKIQLQNTVKRQTTDVQPVKLEVDFTKYSIMELIKYTYSQTDLTEEEEDRIALILFDKAEELKSSIQDGFIIDLDNTAILLDVSDSHKGSKETKLHPLLKNLTLTEILRAGMAEGSKGLYYLGGTSIDGRLQPEGHTDLSQGLLSAVKDGFTNIIVLSDGFENVGSFDKVYTQLKKIGYDLNVVHFNPVFSPKNFSFKKISDQVLSIPYTDEKDLTNLALFCLLATDKEKFKEVIRAKITAELL